MTPLSHVFFHNPVRPPLNAKGISATPTREYYREVPSRTMRQAVDIIPYELSLADIEGETMVVIEHLESHEQELVPVAGNVQQMRKLPSNVVPIAKAEPAAQALKKELSDKQKAHLDRIHAESKRKREDAAAAKVFGP